MIDYSIISTGSKGNAVVINKRILIDCGVPFKALADAYHGLQLALLTHIHGDHFNRATIRALARERPTLRWGVPAWLASEVVSCGVNKRNIDIFEAGRVFAYSGRSSMTVMAFPLIHNAPNCGYRLRFAGTEESMLYATDTNSMDGIEAKHLSLYMLEANYSEPEIIERIREKQEAGQYCYETNVLNNHLSKEKADDWLYKNMGPNSRYVYLHTHE